MLSWQETVVRLFVAAVLGGLIGLDRSRRDLGAGLRTHMLVSVGSALLMLVSSYGFSQTLKSSLIVLDPSRVAAQVVSGIGFLGAGTILLRKEIVRGLTTAAGIWAVAAIGLAVGGGLYGAALFATAIILGILVVLKPIERRFLRRLHTARIVVTWDSDRCELSSVTRAVQESKPATARFQIDYQFTGGVTRTERADLVVTNHGAESTGQDPASANSDAVAAVITRLKKLNGVLKIECASPRTTVSETPEEEERQ